jgi:quinoprotein glucose dehydrogenase
MVFIPPSENGTLVFPGNLGVFEWGGMSNADRQVAVMNPIGLPFVSRLIPADPNRLKLQKVQELSRACNQCMGAIWCRY